MMRNKRFILKVFILVWTYILLLEIFWDILTAVRGFDKFYVVFQLLYAGFYTMAAIALTEDRKYIEDAWDKDGLFKKIYGQLLHYSAFVVFLVPMGVLFVIAALSSDDSTKEMDYCWKELKVAVDNMDKSPVIVRSFIPFGAIAVCMAIIISFNLFPENLLLWIQEIIATLVSLISLIFIILNVRATEQEEL